jgi:hypothetical protein
LSIKPDRLTIAGDTGIIHGLVALATFVTSSLSAIAAYRLLGKPFAYISAVIGVFSMDHRFWRLLDGSFFKWTE